MSMSVDTRQIELAVQFASLLELLMDPKKLRGTIEEIKVVLADYKEKLGLIATKQEADSYLEKARVTLEEANAYLAKEKALQDANFKALSLDLSTKKEELVRNLQILKERQEKADSDASKAEQLKIEANKLFEAAYRRDKESAAQAAELAKLEIRLNEKQAKLNQILG